MRKAPAVRRGFVGCPPRTWEARCSIAQWGAKLRFDHLRWPPCWAALVSGLVTTIGVLSLLSERNARMVPAVASVNPGDARKMVGVVVSLSELFWLPGRE
jgi:hypothetical protein